MNYHSFYCNNDFGMKERKKFIKTTILVKDKSQINVAYYIFWKDPQFKGDTEEYEHKNN